MRALRVLRKTFKKTRGNTYDIAEESLVDLWVIAIWKQNLEVVNWDLVEISKQQSEGFFFLIINNKMQEEREKLRGKWLSPKEAGFDCLESYQTLQIIK